MVSPSNKIEIAYQDNLCQLSAIAVRGFIHSDFRTNMVVNQLINKVVGTGT
ncbi:hypothetical protein B6N60_03379 [Richelia sinica FACHB-800]|uniref:Uncharacterized protein n=1 Tax=Richelia sinica FACHB-800 TaxID=1357546 RepID=A0A975Y5X2_9NOST|nr:hypothetical protein [Richelia sinica]MBD2663486.1 hypothetical protein [Richelia sinica FACHB-800]QXE24672.1 hypothetical protein B6N60_03379 [Richelia sinica FACHB-800]